MEWLEKVRYLKTRREQEGYNGEYYIDLRVRPSKWQVGELEELIKSYPWLPKSYREFIKEFDNLGLTFVSFFGSKEGKIIPLAEEIEYWYEYLKEDYFPFGKDADGSIFTLNKKGEVILFDIDDYECEKPVKISDSFEKFIGDYVLGKDYTATKTKFYELLKSVGWV